MAFPPKNNSDAVSCITIQSVKEHVQQGADKRAAGELEGQRSGGAVVNDMPVACQSRAVTEPQREKAHLKYNKPPSKSLDTSTTFGAKQHFDNIKMLGG